ncbi:26S proteasome non-ATPase regulatory subunit 2 [Oopsacas minuta]|uniref:26S proteasome non-ATPase regulatory subunit 2 n=1 Tax=Oopsacas minuta TaxID=111878 RepID=A0AAV7KTZ6_9METZ|nr:26S proteasome non-ATPase regulatory subunit 2 [Oopsacas minuta]
MSEKTEKKSDTKPTKEADTEEPKLPAEELSEEDIQLKEELLLLVERLEDEEAELRQNSLNILRNQIRSSTSSMTSVPKPLKFLRPHFQQIVLIYDKYPEGEIKKELADVLSVLGMTIGEKRDCLKYRLQGTSDAVSTWGHEYIRHLSGEIQAEYQEKIKGGDDEMEQDADYLIHLVKEIVPFNMQHNAECEACDLLMEVEMLERLEDYVDELAHERVCLYLVSCVQYVAEPENTTLLTVAISIFRKYNKLAAAMKLAMQLNDLKLIKDIFFSCNDELLKKQLCFMLGRQQVFLEIPEDEMESSNELLREIISNSQLNQHFLALARELDIVEPKLPDDVMKNHSDPPRTATQDQSKMFLASTFVNGFVNCAFGKDKVTMDADNQAWLGKVKDNGMISAVASLGLIMLWDVDTGLTHIDKYIYSQDIEIKAGALLATGIVNCGIRNECDPAMGILSEFVSDANVSHIKMKIAAILGLGLAYAGSCREDLIVMLTEVFTDKVSNANDKLITSEVISVTALSIGFIALGSCNAELALKLLTIFSKEGYNVKSTYNRFIILAVGLIFLGKQKAANDIANAFDSLPAHLKDFGVILLDVCAYAGTGNVLKIQSLLHKASEFFSEEDEKEKDTKGKENLKDPTAVAGALHEPGAHQAITVLGIALVAMGEEIGAEMSLRTFSHLVRFIYN